MEYFERPICRYRSIAYFCAVICLTYLGYAYFDGGIVQPPLPRISSSFSDELNRRDEGGDSVGDGTQRIELMKNGSDILDMSGDLGTGSPIQPPSGNTLPNFLLRGRGEGLTWRDYRDGVVVFLHHNKAAGTTIKACLRGMTRSRILKSPELYKLMSYSTIMETTPEELVRNEVFSGGYSFWLCELFEGRNCSYFTFLRDPIDRVISAYFYCEYNRGNDQLCGPLEVGNFTIKEWAIYQGNYFFYQLLMDRRYCLDNPQIRELFRDGSIDESIVPPGTSKYILYNGTNQCWFKQRVLLNSVLSQADRNNLVKNILENLESWFSVIGLTEEFDLSLRMMEATYNLPFYKLCRGKVNNEGIPVQGTDERTYLSDKENMRRSLESDPEVQDSLKLDFLIYEKARRIFQRQKEMLGT